MEYINIKADRVIYTRYAGRGSDLGNPFTHLPLARTKAYIQVATAEESVSCCEAWARGDTQWDHIVDPVIRAKFWHALRSLKDHDVLACWCKPRPCHCEVIIKLWKELQGRN